MRNPRLPLVTLIAVWYAPSSSSEWISSPAFVRVFPIKFTTTSRLVSGRPRQFCVMWQNIRCSILFHLLVPGGKWQIPTRNPVSSASRCKHTFHNRFLVPLLPPPSAVISNSLAVR